MNAPTTANALKISPATSNLGHSLEAAIDAGAIDLPLMPGTAMKVFRLAQETDADMKELAELIESDQKIAISVLRVVNSAAYSPKTEIVTLRQAVARLGLKPLAEIVIAGAFKAAVFEDERYMDAMLQYFRDGLACALWNKELARLRRQNVETAYLCGLLHNMGKPLVLKYASEQLQEAPEAEIHVAVDALYPAIGARLAQAWELPGPVQAAVRWHPEYEKAPDYRDDACAVNAALLLAAQTHVADGEQAQAAVAGAVSIQALNVYPDDVEKMLAKRERMALQLESFQ